MKSLVSLYDILRIDQKATSDEIKSAYRRLAKLTHPDVSAARHAHSDFIVINNAYRILSDAKKRGEYDFYLDSMRVEVKSGGGGKHPVKLLTGELILSLEEILSHINYFLWDIEIFLRNEYPRNFDRKISGLTVRQYIIRMLVFIDKWILFPSGHQDYFAQARQMRNISFSQYISMIDAPYEASVHRPFYSLSNYYYDVRKRIDMFLNTATLDDLEKKISGGELRLIDAVMESQNYVIYYMSSLRRVIEGGMDAIAPFAHSHDEFNE